MGIESIMYFALGALAAGLIALMIMPAIWRRAVRLTKKRIEAATPMNMAEFRADKDQLRAQFALSTRRLEMNVETLRKRLADQVGDIGRRRDDLTSLKTDRDQHLAVVSELEARELDLRGRVLQLEKEGVDLAQRLRMSERDYAAKASDLATVREAIRSNLPRGTNTGTESLSGDYDEDIEGLLTSLEIERKRASFLEDQARSLIARLESSDRRSADTNAAIAELRRSLAIKDDAAERNANELVVAEASIASAENRLNALLEETRQLVDGQVPQSSGLLAEKLTQEDQVDKLRRKVLGVETSIMDDWDEERLDPARLRERLGDIASEVSRLVYVADAGPAAVEAEESLFDKVQKFADDGRATEEFTVQTKGRKPSGKGAPGKVSARMTALQEMRSRR
jgi:chromosome segregation ATPase